MGFEVVWQDNIPIHPLLANEVWDKLAQCGSEVRVLPADEVLAWLRMRAATPTGKPEHRQPSLWFVPFFSRIQTACVNACALCVQKPETHSAVTGQKTCQSGHIITWRNNERQHDDEATFLGLAKAWFDLETNMTAAVFYSEVILRSSLKILSEDVISEVISLVEDLGLCVKHPTGSALP